MDHCIKQNIVTNMEQVDCLIRLHKIWDELNELLKVSLYSVQVDLPEKLNSKLVYYTGTKSNQGQGEEKEGRGGRRHRR